MRNAARDHGRWWVWWTPMMPYLFVVVSGFAAQAQEVSAGGEIAPTDDVAVKKESEARAPNAETQAHSICLMIEEKGVSPEDLEDAAQAVCDALRRRGISVGMPTRTANGADGVFGIRLGPADQQYQLTVSYEARGEPSRRYSTAVTDLSKVEAPAGMLAGLLADGLDGAYASPEKEPLLKPGSRSWMAFGGGVNSIFWSGDAEFAAMGRNLGFSLRGRVSRESNLATESKNAGWTTEISPLITGGIHSRHLIASVGIGVSLLTGTRRSGSPTDEGGVLLTWYNYDLSQFTAVGLPVEARLFWVSGPVGLGLVLYHNQSAVAPYTGLSVELQFGRDH